MPGVITRHATPVARAILASCLALCLAIAASFDATAADGPRADGAWLRATPPGMSMAAVYLRLTGGSAPDRLLGASCECADAVEIHVTTEEHGVASMRPVTGLALPARATLEFAPQGHHLMLVGLHAPLAARDSIVLRLRFEKSGELEVEAIVREATATSASGGSGHRH